MDMSVQPGQVLLGKYRVESVLGQGGMGVVVAARHIELGELFAIKFLLPQALSSPQAVDRFLREARAAARLKGEHVAKVHDVGRLETGAPYMVMEHLSGNDLKHVLRARGPLPVEEAATCVIQACEAIEEAHGAGIVHRDIKPANLFLIRRANGTPCVKVLDFGISKQVSPDGLDLTKTGSLLGSPLYMSPEQMMHTKGVDARSDVWSMGVVLYELLTGTVPFPSESLTEVVGRVLQEEQAPPSRLRPGLPPELDAIVARCLQKRPEQRYQRIGELAAALYPFAGVGATTGAALAAAARASQPSLPQVPAGAARSSQPSCPQVPAAVTGASWGATGGTTRPARTGSGNMLALALIGIIGLAGLAGGGAWLAVRTPAAESAAPPIGVADPIEAAPPAPEVPSAPPTPSPPPPIEAPSAESVASPAPTASAVAPPVMRPGTPKSQSTAPAVPAAFPTPKPTTTSAPAPAPSPTRKRHEGIF